MAALVRDDVNIADAPAAFKSPVWQYFGFQTIEENGVRRADKTKTICKVCYGNVSYATGNTSNMSTHLKRKHPNLHAEIMKGVPSKTTESSTKSTLVNQAKSTPSISSGQLRLHDMLKSKLSQNSPRALTITNGIINLICLN